MTDTVDSKVRSRMMSGIKAKNTKPEMLVRRYLHSMGFRYKLHNSSLPGKPDIVLPKYRTIVFVHGCFWHRHSGCMLAYTPKSNVEAWQKKFETNIARDKKVLAELANTDWQVLVIWECDLRKKSSEALLALSNAILSKH